MNSIMQKEKRCFITGQVGNLHKHHIYGGGNREKSEKYGFYIYLKPEWHNLSNKGIHFDFELNLAVKRACQKEFEKTHSRLEFVKLIGKSYIVDDGIEITLGDNE